MNLQDYYKSLTLFEEESAQEIMIQLLDNSSPQINMGLNSFSKTISSHIGDKDLKRLLPGILPQLISNNAFTLDNGETLLPREALDMIEGVLYLTILAEEFTKKSGRRTFFISNFKSVKTDMVFLAFEILVNKAVGNSIQNLLALFIGTKQYDLNLLINISPSEKIKLFTSMTRKKRIGIFQDNMFLGFANNKKINDADALLQNIFEEISSINDYFKKQGTYYELYGDITGILTMPPKPEIKSPPSTPIKAVITPLQKNLSLLSLKEVPATKQELKKIFFKLAAATHPDKFEHLDKGTRTEIAIVDKFREIYSAYEMVEKEIEKKN